MSNNPNAELMETTYNLYDADGRFRNNYPSIAEAKVDCDPGDTARSTMTAVDDATRSRRRRSNGSPAPIRPYPYRA